MTNDNDRAFHSTMANLRSLLSELSETDRDPVQVRREYAQAMLDLNAIISEEHPTINTSQYIERWKEKL